MHNFEKTQKHENDAEQCERWKKSLQSEALTCLGLGPIFKIKFCELTVTN